MGRAEDLFKKIEDEGEAAIDELIATRKSEELFLDFKRSSNNGSAQRLSDTDRNNFAKAISGFGNSEGGVIVWGVDCSRDAVGADVARFRVPITDAARYTSWLEGVVSGCTVPPHQGVRSFPIVAGTSTDGYVATLILKSNHAPHQVVGRLQYYIRAGSDFVPAPHAVLAGMFGRVPQPHLFHKFTVDKASVEDNGVVCSVGILVRNQGPGIASDIFVNLLVFSHPGDRCELNFDQTDRTNWSGIWSFGRHISLISQPSYRLPPEAHVQPIVMNLRLTPPFTEPIHIEGMAGTGTSPPYRFKLHQTPEKLTEIYSKFMSSYKDGTLTKEEISRFGIRVFGIEEDMEGRDLSA